MAKSQTPKSYQSRKDKRDYGQRPAASAPFHDRNLMNVNPLDEQFEPTEEEPVRQRARMAGDPPPQRQYKEAQVKRDVDQAQGTPVAAASTTQTTPPPTTGKYGTGNLSAGKVITKKRGDYSDR